MADVDLCSACGRPKMFAWMQAGKLAADFCLQTGGHDCRTCALAHERDGEEDLARDYHAALETACADLAVAIARPAALAQDVERLERDNAALLAALPTNAEHMVLVRAVDAAYGGTSRVSLDAYGAGHGIIRRLDEVRGKLSKGSDHG